MDRYEPAFRGKPWTPGLRVLHMYAVPHFDGAYATLVHRCRRAMTGTPILQVRDEFLHITLDMVTGADSSGVDDAQRAALVTALQEELADVPAFDLTLGSPLAVRSGLLLDVHPDDQVNDLHQHVRRALTRTLPSDWYRADAPAHLSLGYSYDSQNGDRLADDLLQIRPSHVATRIDAVHLVDVLFEEVPTKGHRAWELSWNLIAEIPLRDADSHDATVWVHRHQYGHTRWTRRMLHQYVEGLGPEGLLVTWRICSTPGVPVDSADLGAFVLPGGTEKEQLARANVGVRQGHKQGRDHGHGMPFDKAYRNRVTQATYTADPDVAATLLDAIRHSTAFAELCRVQPLLQNAGHGQDQQEAVC